ncbi:PPC domain-containing protein [Candidatus Sumerlaeota bacterium]|nr:PPC domain-containing protein [Candidatus Sumerlaeota bacterium]
MRHRIPTPVALLLIASLPAGALAFTPLPFNGEPITGSLVSGETEWIPPADPRCDARFLRDIYTFEVASGETIDISLEAEFDAVMMLYTEQGHLAAANNDFTGQFNARIAVTLQEPGRHFLNVSSYFPGTTGTYRLIARRLGVGAPLPEDFLGATRVQVFLPDLPMGPSGDPIEGRVVEGELEESDFPPLPEDLAGVEEIDLDLPRDVHPLEAVAGTVITVDLRARFDGNLLLLSPGGRLIASNGDYSRMSHSRIAAAPLTETGTHQIVVAPCPLDGAGGSYTLTIAEPQSSPGFSPDTSLMMGETVSGELTSEDRAEFWARSERVPFGYHRDGFVFDGEAGQEIRVDMTEDFRMHLYLLNPDGEEIGFTDDWQLFGTAQLTATLTQTGPHRLVVTTLSPESTGHYTLTLRD